MKNIYMLSFIVLISMTAVSQTADTMGGYTSMEIEAGHMKGNFASGAIEEMSGGVRIRLDSEDTEVQSLPISANSMRFKWEEGRTTPTTIIMEGSVDVQHPDASITAERAEWNFDTGQLVFSGNPEVNNDRMKGLRGEKMSLNLKTNTFEVTQVRADQVPLQTPNASKSPASKDKINVQDITDWKQLIDAIKAQAQADAPSPGKQILSQMEPQNQ
ncbi:MAG: hypothetical protein KAH38_07030, partial [Candidatus Hydrogenedentes bacterium]|nr:hypothetical protein [Candidatus Hydrogenedentota bacterium]